MAATVGMKKRGQFARAAKSTQALRLRYSKLTGGPN
jgi:hypothetical protein